MAEAGGMAVYLQHHCPAALNHHNCRGRGLRAWDLILIENSNPFYDTLIPLWTNARYVFVDEGRIRQLARDWSREEFPVPDWRQIVFPDDDLAFVDFIGVGNAINFAFTNFTNYKSYLVEYRGQLWRGAYAMWAALKRALDNNVPLLNPTYLRKLNRKEFRIIFEG